MTEKKTIETHIEKDKEILSDPTISPQMRRHTAEELKELERYEKPTAKRNKSKSAAKLREQRRQEKHDKPKKSY